MRKEGKLPLEYVIQALTDVGISKNVNQDSYCAKVYETSHGKIGFMVLCDGMGGLSHGEIASSTVINEFENWADERLPYLCSESLVADVIKSEWDALIQYCNSKISDFGTTVGTRLGTTLVGILFDQDNYFAVNVGDSRLYEISDKVRVLTKDQTLVAREVELGVITAEQALNDPRRSILLQCIGASQQLFPEFISGKMKKDSVYMLCSDGFRHEISDNEIYEKLCSQAMTSPDVMLDNMKALIELNKNRNEKDNITVVCVKTI